LLVSAYAELAQFLLFPPVVTPDCILCLHPGYRQTLKSLPEGLKLALQTIPPGVYELGCHPGLRDPTFSDDPYWHERRELELRILTDPAFRAVIEQHNIELINYSQLGVAGRGHSSTPAGFGKTAL
jgi:hypothetical protein